MANASTYILTLDAQELHDLIEAAPERYRLWHGTGQGKQAGRAEGGMSRAGGSCIPGGGRELSPGRAL